MDSDVSCSATVQFHWKLMKVPLTLYEKFLKIKHTTVISFFEEDTTVTSLIEESKEMDPLQSKL